MRSCDRCGATAFRAGRCAACGAPVGRVSAPPARDLTIPAPRAGSLPVVAALGHGIATAFVATFYGVGFANLRLVQDLRPDYVKISGYFCRDSRDPTVFNRTVTLRDSYRPEAGG